MQTIALHLVDLMNKCKSFYVMPWYDFELLNGIPVQVDIFVFKETNFCCSHKNKNTNLLFWFPQCFHRVGFKTADSKLSHIYIL